MLKDLVLKNRSYRGFDKNYKVTREQLMEMVDCARLTASSVNQQPLKYYLVTDNIEVSEVQKLTNWARALKDITLPHNGKCPTAFIVICLDKNISESVSAFQKDVGIAAQTILLSAVEMELGGCMIGSFDAEKIGVLLKFDENIVPLLVVAVGKPDDKIVLQEVSDGESIKYSRDENDIHYVPKRKLKDILLNTKGVE